MKRYKSTNLVKNIFNAIIIVNGNLFKMLKNVSYKEAEEFCKKEAKNIPLDADWYSYIKVQL